MAQEQSSLDRVRAELICSFCLDLLTEPRRLNCDHSFCQNCLQKCLQTSAQPTDSTPIQAALAGSEQRAADILVCPCCRAETILPDDGILGLKLNFNLKNLVDILNEEEREKTVQALGKEHKVKCHKECTQHKEPCTFFCEDCKELICRKCLSNSHKQHSWNNYDEILPKLKEELRSCIHPGYEAAVSAYDAMQQLDKHNTAVTQEQDSVKGKVEEYFGQLVATLEQRKSELLSMVDHYTECKLDMVKRHYSDLQSSYSSLVQHLEQIEKQMREDDVSLLTGSDDIKQKISLHRDSILKAVSANTGFDSVIKLREESLPLQLGHLGRLLLCQKDAQSDALYAIREFIDTGDMETIQFDLARATYGVEVPLYMQFEQPAAYEDVLAPRKLPPNTSRTSQPPPQIPLQEAQVPGQLVEVSTAPQPHSHQPPSPLPPFYEAPEPEEQPPIPRSIRKPPIPLPPIPQGQHGESSMEHPPERLNTRKKSKKRDKTNSRGANAMSPQGEDQQVILESEDPYDVIPALKGAVHHHFCQSQVPGPSSLPAINNQAHSCLTLSGSYQSVASTRPVLVRPIQVINLYKDDIHPSGITRTHMFGNLIITDTSNMCMHVLHEEAIIHTVGRKEERDGCPIEFKKPVAVAIGRDNCVYVLEQENPTTLFHKVTLAGKVIFTTRKKSHKGPQKPWGIAVSNDSKVYISDWMKRRVYIYSATTGKKIRSIKGYTRREKEEEFVEFRRPTGIAFDKGDRLMIADRGEKCVWCINTDGDELIKKVGEDHLQDPYGIGVAKDGRVVVTESESDCVSVFGVRGELLQYFGGSGSNEGQFCRPHHVFVDESDRVFIADKENRRIQIFMLEEYAHYESLA